MTTINQLTAVDELAAGDNLPGYIQAEGDTRRFSLTTLTKFLSTAFKTLTASSYLKVKPCLVAALPSAAEAGAGARAFVTDASATTFASVVAGGDSNVVPVFSDGEDWRIG